MSVSKMDATRSGAVQPTLRLCATAWSLRQYPTEDEEWSWPRKFAAIAEAGFDGLMSPPLPELAERGELIYWAISSFGVEHDPRPFYDEATALGAATATVQPCDVDTPLDDCVHVMRRVQEVAREYDLHTGIECHRDCFTETPERTYDLYDGYVTAEGRPLPLCFDHSHYAVVRHLKHPYWPDLKGREELLAPTRQFHMRPFNGHHCQIPATFDGEERTPEYLEWLEYARELFRFIKANGKGEIFVVPELGNANPAYGLSCFPDVWRDACVTGADLRQAWAEA